MECKNRKLRNTLIISSAFLMPVIINKLIFFTAQKRYTMPEAVHTYDWRLGKIAYSVRGKGKPLVLVHGAKPGESSAVWMKNVNSLAESYRVYTIDLLGYGASDRVNTTYTAYTYASMINDFITDVVGRPAAVIAEGEGAVFTAAAYAKDPSNYKKLVFICPKGISDSFASDDDKKKRVLYELPVIGESLYLAAVSHAAVERTVGSLIFSSEKRNILSESLYASAHCGGGVNRYVYASYKTNFMNADIKPYIRNCNIPFFIIWGEQAEDMADFDEVQGLAKKGEYALFEETAGLPNYENAEEFNKAVKEFLK